MSRKEKRIELENKIQMKSKLCPYCKSEMEFGYISAQGYPIVWGKELGIFEGIKDKKPITGYFESIDHIPSLRCIKCEIIIGQIN